MVLAVLRFGGARLADSAVRRWSPAAPVIPIGDSTSARRTPFVNWALIAANILVFIYALSLSTSVTSAADFQAQRDDVCYGFNAAPTEVDHFYCEWSFQPEEWFDNISGDSRTGESGSVSIFVTIFTAIFLHAGWLHIGGNMLFLWVFGDNIEDRLGHVLYLAFYLAGGFVASLIQGMMDPDSVVPVVGASGAVAAVLGAYIVWFPKATIITVLPVFFFLPFPVPAFVMIGLWFVQNLLAGYATLGSVAPDTGVAWFAHIGGFLFGFLLVFLFLREYGRRRRPPPLWEPR